MTKTPVPRLPPMPTGPVFMGDEGLLQLRPGPALDLTRLPELWQPAPRRALASGVGRYRPRPMDNNPRSPAEKELRRLRNGTWCPLARLAFLSLCRVPSPQNRIIDAWVADHAPTLSLDRDPDPQAPQAAWVAAYLLADGRTRSSMATLGHLLAGATAHLPRDRQLSAAAALLGQALELGTLAVQASRGVGQNHRERLATRLAHLQSRLLGHPHPQDTVWPKAATALALATGVRVDQAERELESHWLKALPRCWRYFVSLGEGRFADQSGIDGEALEAIALPQPVPHAHPDPSPGLADAWSQVICDVVDLERHRRPSSFSPRERQAILALLAVRTLQRHGQALPIGPARELLQAPPGTFDPVRSSPAVAAGLRQAAMEACLGEATPAPPPRPAARL